MLNNPFNPFQRYWSDLKFKLISTEEFMEIMKKEGYQPCKTTWFKHCDWTLEDTVLIYHNWEPTKFKTVSLEVLKGFIEFIDNKDDIFGILNSYIPSDLFTNFDYLKVAKIITLFKQKNIKIPEHFPKELFLEVEKKSVVNDSYNSKANTSNKLMKAESIRKAAARRKAKDLWEFEKKGNLVSTPKEMANNKELKRLVEQLNISLKIRPWGGDENDKALVDSEWFSDLYPGDNKRGPKQKQQKTSS